MKLIYWVMLVLCPATNRAQGVKALMIGDKVPPMVLSHIVNYPVSKMNLSRFTTKLLILDFMTTGCASCIEALPRLDSLQKEYEGQVRIILVIPETEEKVRAFFKRKYIKYLSLPAIAEDTVLGKLFPYTYISHEVLINKGTVKAITYPEYINRANIGAILEGRDIFLPVKRDITAFQYSEPLLHLNERIIPDFSFPVTTGYSTLASYMDDVPERFTSVTDTARHVLRISMINVPVIDLYMRTLSATDLRPAFITLEVADTGHYVYKEGSGYRQEWLTRNVYCYEGAFPMNYPASAIAKKISGDLDFYLGLRGRIEKKSLPCWVITKDSTSSPTALPTNNDAGTSFEPAPVPIRDIVFYLDGNFGNTPAIDETGSGELLISGLRQDQYTDVRVLQKKLEEYGLKITLATRSIDMLVITEKPAN